MTKVAPICSDRPDRPSPTQTEARVGPVWELAHKLYDEIGRLLQDGSPAWDDLSDRDAQIYKFCVKRLLTFPALIQESLEELHLRSLRNPER